MPEPFGRSRSRQTCSSFWSVFKHFLLLLLLIAYAVLGAWMFSLLEQNADYMRRVRRNEELDKLKLSLLSTLQDDIFLKGVKIAHFERSDRHQLARKYLDEYEAELSVRPQINVSDWDTFGALFYACSVFTTIGYGYRTPPITAACRAATTVYAIIGVPLFLIFLLDYGTLLFCLYRKLASCCCRSNCNQRQFRWDEVSQLQPKYGQPKRLPVPVDLSLTAAIVIFVLWVLFYAAILILFESWDYFTSLYFVVVSQATIGFGDLIPTTPIVALLVYFLVTIGLCMLVACALIVRSKHAAVFRSVLRQIDYEFQIAQEENMQERMAAIGSNQGLIDIVYRQPLSSRMLYGCLGESERVLLQKYWSDKSKLRSRGSQTGIFEIQGGEMQFRAAKMVQFRSDKDPDANSLGSYVTAYGYMPGKIIDDSDTPNTRLRPQSPSSLFGREKYPLLNSTGTANNFIMFPQPAVEQAPVLLQFDQQPQPQQQCLTSPIAFTMESEKSLEVVTAPMVNDSVRSPYRAVTYSDDELSEPYHPPPRKEQQLNTPLSLTGAIKKESFRIFRQPPPSGRNILEDSNVNNTKFEAQGATGSVEYLEPVTVSAMQVQPMHTQYVVDHNGTHNVLYMGTAVQQQSMNNTTVLPMSQKHSPQTIMLQSTLDDPNLCVSVSPGKRAILGLEHNSPATSLQYPSDNLLLARNNRASPDSSASYQREDSPSINSLLDVRKRPYGARPLPDYLLPEVLVEKSSSPQPEVFATFITH